MFARYFHLVLSQVLGKWSTVPALPAFANVFIRESPSMSHQKACGLGSQVQWHSALRGQKKSLESKLYRKVSESGAFGVVLAGGKESVRRTKPSPGRGRATRACKFQEKGLVFIRNASCEGLDASSAGCHPRTGVRQSRSRRRGL
jgi:hypothetical protein